MTGPRVALILFAVPLMFAAIISSAFGKETVLSESALAILPSNAPGPKKIPFELWTEAESSAALREGDNLIFTLQAGDDATLTVIGLLSDGTAMILFPNQLQPDNKIKGGAVYTFFGEDSPLMLRVGKKVPGSWLVFILNTSGVTVDWSKIGAGDLAVRIKASSDKEVQGLKEALAVLADDEKFNCVIVPIESLSREGFDMQLMKPESTGKPHYKRLPSTLDSRRPGTVTGSQGYGDKPEEE